MADPMNVKCPSCGQILAVADESGLVGGSTGAPLRRARPGIAALKGKGERRRSVARF